MMAILCVSLVLLLVVGVPTSGLSEHSREKRQPNIADSGVPTDEMKQLERSELLYTTPDFVKKYGYPIETHTVTTEDGYMLSLHRIPGSPKAASSGVKKPVLLQHGMGAASDCFVLMGPERGLGFILADEGYDVWLGNARGNRYSRKHVSMSPRNYSYYNFTWHEMGMYDLPALIDHILLETRQVQLFYIGHSMGGTMFFVLTSMKPEYNKKIRLGMVMAPGVFFKRDSKSIISTVLPYAREIYVTAKKAKVASLGVSLGMPFARLINGLCGNGKPFQKLCIYSYFAIVGFNSKELNTTMLPTILSHGMMGNTINLPYHYAQLIMTGRFQKFDRSSRGFSPQTEYDLSKVSAPVSVHYAQNDFLVPVEGAIQLSQRLPNLVKLVKLPDDSANHNDFIFATHIRELVINEILDLMGKY